MNDLLTNGISEELGAGIYVDVENMQGYAQSVVTQLVENWPVAAPEPSRLSLYVRADQAELWRMWAESHFPNLPVYPKGVQHFSASHSKNSADIAIAVDAIADILLERIRFVVVVSDDSDFISLYSKIRAEQSRLGFENGKVPFLWVLTDRPGTKSSTIKDYFPNDHIFTVEMTDTGNSVPNVDSSGIRPDNEYELMAQTIIEEIPLGNFKSTDTQVIVRSRWQNHSLATASKQVYGEEFRKKLLPILSRRGVLEPNTGKRPREYEMTNGAKESTS